MTKIATIISTVIFLAPIISFAQVKINEVQLLPTEERFVELYNTTDSAIDLTGWYMQRKTATGSSFGSLVSNSNFGGKTIGPREFFVISKNSLSASDIVLSSLTLTESNAIQIKNSSGDVVDKIGWGSSDECDSSCPPNPPDGQSIQRTASGWVVSLPTLGAANNNSNSQNNNSSGEILAANTESESQISSNMSATSGVASPKYSTPDVQLDVSSGGDRLTSPGSPISFQARILKNSVSNSAVNFSWSFGDGEVGSGALVSHMYKYSGEYAVVLNAAAGNTFATSRFKVKVVEPSVSVSDEGGYIKIINNSAYEINLFNWKIVNGGRGFVFQPDTIIFPKSEIKVDKKLLTMKGEIEQNTVLKNFLGQAVAFADKKMTESELKDLSTKTEDIKKQAAYIIDKAIGANLVLEKTPAIVQDQTQNNLAAASISQEQVDEIFEDSGNVIYEAPKQTGFFDKLTNFIKRVFSR